MQSGKFFALRAEGDFGNAIRDEIYKRNGFTKLKGNTYPHHDQTWGIFPARSSGNAYYYSGLMEQIYADHVAHSDNAIFVMKVALVTAMALASAAIIILSGGIGTGVAAAFFETGTAGFIVTQVGVTAVAMTVIGEGIGQAMGQGSFGQRQSLLWGR